MFVLLIAGGLPALQVQHSAKNEKRTTLPSEPRDREISCQLTHHLLLDAYRQHHPAAARLAPCADHFCRAAGFFDTQDHLMHLLRHHAERELRAVMVGEYRERMLACEKRIRA